MITTRREATAAMGSGFDDFLLPGDSSQEIKVYLVECPNGHYSYYSPHWVRGAVCPSCGSRMRVTVSDKDAIDEALTVLPEAYLDPARGILIALKSGGTAASRELQADLDLSPFIFGTVVTHLVDLGLVDIESEGTPKEGLRLTTRGKRVLKSASVI